MSFLAPWGLALGALAGPLLALYFLRIRRKRVRVPSLLLWQELSKTERLATPFQKFQRNLLLLLQLLLLALIVLAFARPYLEADVRPVRSVVILVDTSASMGATDGNPTRLADAVEGALDIVDDLGAADEVMLVVSGASTEVLVPFTRDAAQARAALRGLAPTDAEGSLKEGVELALSLSRSRPGVDVLVYSDGGGADLGDVAVGDAVVHFVPVGRSAENAGIVALDLRRSPTSDLERQLFVTVQHFGADTVDGSVEVALGGKVVGLRTEPIPPDSPVSMVFDLPASASGELRVTLDTPGDLLPADDEAFAVVSAAAERKVLLVGVDGLTARALRADPRFALSVASATTAEQASNYDAVVFGGAVPEGMDGQDYLVLGPHAGGPPKYGADVKSPSVLGWRRTHPAMRFVEWDGVMIARSKTILDQGGLQPIVESDAGPLVLAGERQGGRVVVLAFDPFLSDLPLRVAWPVLVLNSLGWVTEDAAGGEGTAIVSTGSPWVRRLPDGTDPGAISVKGPRGSGVEAQVADGILRVRDTAEAGVYQVSIGASRTAFAANLLSARESRIAPRGTLELGGGSVVTAATEMLGRREIWRELLLFGLGIMMVEWFAWNRRRTP